MKSIRLPGIRAVQTRALCRVVADLWSADPAWRAIAHLLIPPGPHIAQRIHRLVRDEIVYRPEQGEVVQAPGVTLRRGYGDCDCKSVLVCALAGAHGVRSRLMLLARGPGKLVTIGPHEDPTGRRAFHIWPQLWVDGRWRDCETCHPPEMAHAMPPAFGEHPAAVMVRFGAVF